MKLSAIVLSTLLAPGLILSLAVADDRTAAVVTGELRRWHCITLTFDGPKTDEKADPNPFLDYRLQVTFQQGDLKYSVPGFYAGDGRGGDSGSKWRVYFSPPQTGTWSYKASFRKGAGVAVSLDPAAGSPAGCHGAAGRFDVAESDKSGRDFRSPDKGLLINRGHHYLTFGGSGKPWVKGGLDIPENFLGYDGFDNTPKARHLYKAHAADWHHGDPDWGDGSGKRIIGAVNYIADKGANSLYFLPMNIGGDGRDTFPTIAEQVKTRYDISKLAQWEIVFAHAQSKGIFLHFLLAETEWENEEYHDEGRLGPERKLYYREMIARFGHHPGLEFNLGEENDYGTERRKQFAAYIKAIDPYDHPVTTHTRRGAYEEFYAPLLGNADFDITSFQGGDSGQNMVALIRGWRNRSAKAGVPWAISFDEPQKIENDADDEKSGYPYGRRDKMWPVYIAGGAGFEWYVQNDGGGHYLDQRIDDFHEMEAALKWTGYALTFLDMLPLLQMAPADEFVSNGWCLADTGTVYAIYLPHGGSAEVGLGSGTYRIDWFNPRSGGKLKSGSVASATGPGRSSIGEPPADPERDWAVLIRLTEGDGSGAAAVRKEE